MAASDHVSPVQWRSDASYKTKVGDSPPVKPEQLPMFMSGREITSRFSPHPGDIHRADRDNAVIQGIHVQTVQMNRKLKESKNDGEPPARPGWHSGDTGHTDELSTWGAKINNERRNGIPSTYESIKAEGVKNPVNLYSSKMRSYEDGSSAGRQE